VGERIEMHGVGAELFCRDGQGASAGDPQITTHGHTPSGVMVMALRVLTRASDNFECACAELPRNRSIAAEYSCCTGPFQSTQLRSGRYVASATSSRVIAVTRSLSCSLSASFIIAPQFLLPCRQCCWVAAT